MRHVSIAAGLVLSLFTQTALAAPAPFPDMEHSFYRYREAVDYLKGRGIIGGYPDGTFQPKQTINRAELLKILYASRTDLVPPERRCFSDVNQDEWYAPYICTAKDTGVIDGYPDGTYKPGDPVNFAEAIKIILNVYGTVVSEATGPEWYAPFVQELDEQNILPDDSYLPSADLNRERAADLLWRVLRHQEQDWNPALSPGCKIGTGTVPKTVTVNGVQRSFLLTVPHTSGNEAVPLIIAFHGRTNSNEQVRKYYRLDREITDSIIAYPAGMPTGNGSFTWSDPGDKFSELRDIAFFDALVETLANAYCIDMNKIRVVGHSLGAWFANAVACTRGGVVQASATVGGSAIAESCSGPSSALIINNAKDEYSAESSAILMRDLRMAENGCSATPTKTGPEYLNCTEFAGCDADVRVLWCPHTRDTDERGQYYPHNWPKETAKHIEEFFMRLDH